jgi:hypothetical protein
MIARSSLTVSSLRSRASRSLLLVGSARAVICPKRAVGFKASIRSSGLKVISIGPASQVYALLNSASVWQGVRSGRPVFPLFPVPPIVGHEAGPYSRPTTVPAGKLYLLAMMRRLLAIAVLTCPLSASAPVSAPAHRNRIRDDARNAVRPQARALSGAEWYSVYAATVRITGCGEFAHALDPVERSSWHVRRTRQRSGSIFRRTFRDPSISVARLQRRGVSCSSAPHSTDISAPWI